MVMASPRLKHATNVKPRRDAFHESPVAQDRKDRARHRFLPILRTARIATTIGAS